MLKKRRYSDEESDDNNDIYSKDVRELLLDDDELSPMEVFPMCISYPFMSIFKAGNWGPIKGVAVT